MNRQDTGAAAPLWREPKAVALLMAATLTTMANATISPALPGLRAAFAADPDAEILTRLLVPAPALGVILAAPLAGIAADRIGRRPLLLAGIALFALTGSAGLVLPDLHTILASRLALGVAVALIMTTQTALVGDHFSGQRRQALSGLQIAARNFGGLIFILLAGMLAVWSPRLPFGIHAVAALYLPLIWVMLPAAATVPAPAAAAEKGRAGAGWIAAILALAALQMLTNMAFFVVPTQLPFHLVSLGYHDPRSTGVALAVLMLTGGATALAFGRMQRAIGHAGTYALGFTAMAAGYLALAFAPDRAAVLGAVAAIGAGYAAVMPNFVALALRIAPAGRAGTCGAILTASVFLGQFVSPLASTPAIAAFGAGATFSAMAAGLAVVGAAALAARVISARGAVFRPLPRPANSAPSR